MKILFLDDESIRFTRLRNELIQYEVLRAKTAKEAIKIIEEHSPPVIFLDHDLDDSWDNSEHPNTGMTVAKYIAHEMKYKPELVIAHSMNVPAATRMTQILLDKNIETVAMPFALIDFKNLYQFLAQYFVKLS